MVTYNVKQAEEMIGLGRSAIWSRLKAMGIKKVKGQYEVTPELIEVLKKKAEPGLSAKIKLNRKYGVSHHIVRNLASKCGISIKSPELDLAIELYKTKEYTLKGIRKRLGIKALEI